MKIGSKINDKDPLLHSGPFSQRELLERFAFVADGFPTDIVISAAANILINGIRQAHPTRQGAESYFDSLFGQLKQLLVDHYDSLGRKRGIFPYDQILEAHHFNARVRKNGG